MQGVRAGLGASRGATGLRRLLHVSLPDLVLGVYLIVSLGQLLAARPSPARDRLAVYVAALLCAYACGVWLCVGPLARARGARLAHHLLPIPTTLGVFLRLREMIPAIHPTDYDALLHRLDLALLGRDLSVAVEPWLGDAAVEWFAFFYYAYYYVGAAFILAMVFLDRDERRLATFATTLLLALCIGWTTYTIAPGLGPLVHLRDAYAGPIPDGFFYRAVISTVDAIGPLRDVLPSQHTGISLVFVIFCFRHLRRLRWPMALWAANVIASTIALRYHYFVDIVAGVVEAAVVVAIVPRWLEAHQERRRAAGLGELPYW